MAASEIQHNPFIRPLEEISRDDTALVGGKNASLGEMIQKLHGAGIRVPGGFATTAAAYWHLIDTNDLRARLSRLLNQVKGGKGTLARNGRAIRRLILRATLPDDLAEAIRTAYLGLSMRYGVRTADVAVRSSATAEDLPHASFAGQQDSFLNVTGASAVLEAYRRCVASLFTDRAIAYREEHGFDHSKVALSVCIQKMVRSDRAGAGVMFTIDPDSGFDRVVVVNAAWGLGESVVQGTITPDEYTVFKPTLNQEGVNPILERVCGEKAFRVVYGTRGKQTTERRNNSIRKRQAFVLQDHEIRQLAQWAVAIEEHYRTPMDIEWAKDARSEELFIVQARPETIESRKNSTSQKTYRLNQQGNLLVEGQSIGQGIATGRVCLIHEARNLDRFPAGSILVTGMTDPDWVPIMKQAKAIVTDQGGRTSHAAIVSRELGVPAIVGTGDATSKLRKNQAVTVSCAEGSQGHVYEGILDYDESEVNIEGIPKTNTRVMLNLSSPAGAFRWWRLPCQGIGLARMEFLINNIIKIHPLALIRSTDVKDEADRKTILELTRGYKDKTEYFVERLAAGIAKMAASRYPDPVIVRMSDFKTNEYAELIGGTDFEPREENPMLGFRGAARYYSDRYREGFALECRAIHRVRTKMGLRNLIIMIPFCRTPEEADLVLQTLADNGLVRGQEGLQVYVMGEIPSNIVLAKKFVDRFDGISIGSNDLTQLTLGIDRDATDLAYLFDERHEAMTVLIKHLINDAHEARRPVGICGQAPSDSPEFIDLLIEAGIDSISVSPDSVIAVINRVAAAEVSLGNRQRESAHPNSEPKTPEPLRPQDTPEPL